MTEAYPLRWPDGWPRTPASDRKRGDQFKRGGWNGTLPTFDVGRRDVLNELDRMGVKTCVISSNVDVRQDGVPRSGVNPNRTSIDPGVAIYFKHRGRPIVIAQDAFETVGVNLRSIALALDAMRALARHGGGTLAGKAFDGFSALPPPAGMKPKRPWWQVLRYPEDEAERAFLSAAEIEARFRTMAKKLHPDAGGSDEEMAELSAARDEAIEAITEQKDAAE
jgi:hypothetical protein